MRRVAEENIWPLKEGFARRLRLESIVSAATAWDDSGRAYDTGVLCARAVDGRRCRGYLRVSRDVLRFEIRWRCARCGDEGVIVAWEDTDGDMSRIWPLPPWAVEPVPGMADEYVRVVVGARDLRLLQVAASWHGPLRNIVWGARRSGRRFLVVGPDDFVRCGVCQKRFRFDRVIRA
jgi:hypothetical protein